MESPGYNIFLKQIFNFFTYTGSHIWHTTAPLICAEMKKKQVCPLVNSALIKTLKLLLRKKMVPTAVHMEAEGLKYVYKVYLNRLT